MLTLIITVFIVLINFNQVHSIAQPLPIQSWSDKTLLFMYAHIDDMEAASGGLVYLLKNTGASVHIVIITNSDKGCGNYAVCGNSTNAELATIRQQEQLRSASILGIPDENIVFLTYEDCLLSTYPEEQIKQDLVRLVRQIMPDIAFTWDPDPKFEMIPSQGWGDLVSF